MGDLLDRVWLKLAHTANVKPRRLRLDRGALSITFDDFPRSAWTEGAPVLAQHGVRATYYASGGLCGRRYLDLDQFTRGDLEEVAAAGHEVGSHAFDHIRISEQTSAGFRASLARNDEFLASALPGVPIRTFAYPFGSVSLAAKLAVAARYMIGRGIGARANVGWIDASEVDSLAFERRQMDRHDLPSLFAEAARKKAWLSVFTHDVSDDPSPWGCRQRDLEGLILEAKQAGLEILPVVAVARRARIGAEA